MKHQVDYGIEQNSQKKKDTNGYEAKFFKCSSSVAIRNTEIKTTWRFHLAPVRTADNKVTKGSSMLAKREQMGKSYSRLLGGQTPAATMEIKVTPLRGNWK